MKIFEYVAKYKLTDLKWRCERGYMFAVDEQEAVLTIINELKCDDIELKETKFIRLP